MREGLLPAILLMRLPFGILAVLVNLLRHDLGGDTVVMSALGFP